MANEFNTSFSEANILVKHVQEGKRILPVWVVFPMAVLFIFVGQLGVLVFYGLFKILTVSINWADLLSGDEARISEALFSLFPQTPFEFALALASAFIGSYLLVWLWVRFVENRPFCSLGLTNANADALIKFGRGFGLGFVMMLLPVGALWLFGFYEVISPLSLQPKVIVGVLIILGGWLVQGPAEELVFRGWLFPVLAAQYHFWLAVVVSALAFAFLHSFNPGLSPIAILNLFLFGLFTILYALREGSIWGVMAIHAVWNWVQGNVLGLEVSGNRTVEAGSLIALQESGPDWLTGGSFGPEGGVAVTALLLISIAILFFYKSQNTNKNLIQNPES